MPIGLRNSSTKISPGCTGFIFIFDSSMIIDDFNVLRTVVFPNKANAPLVVDPYRVLSPAISSKRLQTIARRHAQVLQCRCGHQVLDLTISHPLKRTESPYALACGKPLGILVSKTLDHLIPNSNQHRYDITYGYHPSMPFARPHLAPGASRPGRSGTAFPVSGAPRSASTCPFTSPSSPPSALGSASPP